MKYTWNGGVVEFIETDFFMKQAGELLGNEGIRRLQIALILYPATGAVIPGTKGLRKLRWVSSSKGKRGGLRIIYYWITEDHSIYLLYIYKKSEQEDLSLEELRHLKLLIEES